MVKTRTVLGKNWKIPTTKTFDYNNEIYKGLIVDFQSILMHCQVPHARFGIL